MADAGALRRGFLVADAHDQRLHFGQHLTATDPLERRGRRSVFGSFALPCHLPLTLGIRVTGFGGTAICAALRDHVELVGVWISAAWVIASPREEPAGCHPRDRDL